MGDADKFAANMLATHADMWAEMGKLIDKGPRSSLPTATIASAGSLAAAVALGWVKQNHGQAAADELADVIGHYVDNGGDDDGLFTEDCTALAPAVVGVSTHD